MAKTNHTLIVKAKQVTSAMVSDLSESGLEPPTRLQVTDEIAKCRSLSSLNSVFRSELQCSKQIVLILDEMKLLVQRMHDETAANFRQFDVRTSELKEA